jgi:hypothetical protein
MTDQQLQIDALVELAKKLERDGDLEQAERRYQQALQTADIIYGPLTPETGLVILELMTFYENQDNDKEANQLRDRLKNILIAHLPEICRA